jgi:Transposase DDE domain
MKDRHIKIILKYVNQLAPNKRKPRFSSEYYLTNILDLLNDFNSWRSLKKSVNYKKEKRYHYKTISDIHRLWCKKGVYRKAFEEVRNENIDLDEQEEFDLLIDSTLIINKYGSDNVGYGSETRKKKFSKITMVTSNNDILNVVENKTSSKEIDLENKKFKRKRRGRPRKKENISDVMEQKTKESKCQKTMTIQTLEHDVKGIEPVLENTAIPESKKINLIGDAGYIINEKNKKKLAEKNVTLITPYRRNQKKQNTTSEKRKLKKRSSIERKFRSVKQYNRIHVRKDRYMNNYMGFFYLGIINTF